MRTFSIALLAAVPFITFGAASAVDLQQDLQHVPEESLRAALEKTLAPKYRQGVFEHGEEAIEAIHNVDPALASQVVDMAKQERVELVKRQATVNVTVTTVTDSSVVQTVVTSTTIESSAPPPAQSTTDTPTTPSSTSTTIVNTAHIEASDTSLTVPTVASTTDSQGRQTTLSTNVVITSASASVVVAVTSTNAQGSVVTTSSTVPAVVLSSTDAAGNVRSTTSPINTSVAAQVTSQITSAPKPQTSASMSLRTTTDADGDVYVVTYFPGGEASEVVLQTTTGADGQRRTITSYKQVPPSATATSATAAQSQTGSPTLAAGKAASNAQMLPEMAALVCGVLGMAALF